MRSAKWSRRTFPRSAAVGAAQHDQAEAFWRGGGFLRRRGDVPHAGRDAGDPFRRVAFGGRAPRATFVYGEAERRFAYEKLNTTAKSHDVDFVMLGCPHNSIEQVGLAARLLEGKRLSPNTSSVGVHAARTEGSRRSQRLHRHHSGGRRARPHRYLSGDLAHHAQAHQGRRHGFRQAGALSSRDHRRADVVRLGRRLRRGGGERALEREAGDDDNRSARTQGRRRHFRRRGAGHPRDVSGWGGFDRGPARWSRPGTN